MKKAVLITATYNEIENIEELVTQVQEVFRGLSNYETHHLVVDGRSPDGTGEIVKKLQSTYPNLHLLSVERKGVGADVKKGIDYALHSLNADILVHIDADLSHNPTDIPHLLTELENGFDLVIGSRYVKGGKNDLGLIRNILSYGGNLVMRTFMGITSITEFTNSCRAYTKNLYQKMDQKEFNFDGNTFYPALTYAAYKAKAKIKEIPIVFTERQRGTSKIEVFNYSPILLKYALRTFIKRLYGK